MLVIWTQYSTFMRGYSFRAITTILGASSFYNTSPAAISKFAQYASEPLKRFHSDLTTLRTTCTLCSAHQQYHDRKSRLCFLKVHSIDFLHVMQFRFPHDTRLQSLRFQLEHVSPIFWHRLHIRDHFRSRMGFPHSRRKISIATPMLAKR